MSFLPPVTGSWIVGALTQLRKEMGLLEKVALTIILFVGAYYK